MPNSHTLSARAASFRATIGLAVTLTVSAAVALTVLLPFWKQALSLLLVSELLFPFYFLRHYRKLNAQPEHHAPVGVDHRAVFNRFVEQQLNLARYMCIKDMLRTWFWKVPFEEIKRGNVADLISYGFFYTAPHNMPDGLMEELMCQLEEAWGVQIEPGYNPELEFMAHLWQDLRCHYRPLSFYLSIEFLFLVKHIVMVCAGYTPHSLRGHTYYTKGLRPAASSPPSSTLGAFVNSVGALPKSMGGESKGEEMEDGGGEVDNTPILFLHGVGMGLLPYIPFVMKLSATKRPIIALECSHLGMRLRTYVPSVDDVVSVVIEAMDRHGIDKICVSGHSYGTLKASRLVQLHPERVHSLAIIDPVCLVMFSGKLIHNFVYSPASHSAFTTWFVARDIHHSASVCRNFFWSLLCLWADQMPERTLVVLAGQDELVPVQEALVMLQHESEADILYHSSHKHAEFLKDFEWQDTIVARIEGLFAKEYVRLPHHGIPEELQLQPSSLNYQQGGSGQGLASRPPMDEVPPSGGTSSSQRVLRLRHGVDRTAPSGGAVDGSTSHAGQAKERGGAGVHGMGMLDSNSPTVGVAWGQKRITRSAARQVKLAA